ncbi:NAD(P)/FAD-dependent oxidoreductase [Marinicrinis sediminis]|uniref:NAD(P)/FAD-dependent oxidoreductase n=1 Tax=Marinicrinis sediminis TaxID=1652465 RepID=A0ABW5R7W1_9BACL
MKNIIILGGGYGGLAVAHQLLDKSIPPDTQLILVDRMPFQGLKTEYYALAAGAVADVDIRVQFPADDRLQLAFGEVSRISLTEQQVHFEDREPLSYDQLIIALGCTDKYHNIPGAQEHTYSIQSFSSSRATACRINDLSPYSQVTVVGGGLSGVEIAAELRESRADLNVRIMDRGESVLSPFPQKLRSYVTAWFEDHGIDMVSHASVSRVEPNGIYNHDLFLQTDVTVWTAGIQPVEVVRQLEVDKDPAGRVCLNEYHQIPLFPNVYVVGDCASLPFSPSAQAAEAQGKQVGEVIQALWKQETPKLGQIKLKGVLGSLGKKHGFGLMGKETVMTGRMPRVLKSGVLWMSKHHFG